MTLPTGILKPTAIVVASVILTGCASFSQDGGMETVSLLTKERTGQSVTQARNDQDRAAIDNMVKELLGKPLTPDSAVQIALLNNKGFHASLAELGVVEADLVQAGRMRNPGFSFSRLHGSGEIEIDRSITFDLVGLLTIPWRTGIERQRFEQAKLQAASQAVQLAGETRRAYFNAITAQQTAQYMQQVAEAAQAGADLAGRMIKVGNWSKLDQAREQAFYADATAQLARARHHATAAREQLTRILGVWGAQSDFTLPERLPDIPKAPDDMANLEARAMTQRLDVQMAKRDVDATARALGLTKATGFINVFDAGYINKSQTGKPRESGYEISLELPIFDWGGARSAKAEALYMQAIYRAADTAVRARSEVRESYSAYRTAYDVAKHYRDKVVPLRKAISDEVLLRYNGMLASVFELLSDARDQVTSVNAAIEAQRDFWIAETDLQAAINGSGGTLTTMRSQPAAGETR